MIRGLYAAATGLMLQWDRQEVVANNLANVDTTGYKRDDLTSAPFSQQLVSAVNARGNRVIGMLGGGVEAVRTVTDFSPGEIRPTGNPLDLALEGEGFFLVQTPQGERLTRSGSLTLDNQGYLVTRQGYPVLGEKGPIRLSGADVEIFADGTVRSGGNTIDRIRIVEPQPGEELVKEGANLYRAAGNLALARSCRVNQGALEGSNVRAVTEMVRMIEVARAYEACQKVLAAHDGALDKAVNEVGRV